MGMTFVWSLELGTYGITVNAVAPAGATRMTAALFERSGKEPPPEENPALNAPLVAFLASEQAGARERPDPRPHRVRVHAVPAPEADRVDVARRRLDAPTRSPRTSTRRLGQHLQPVGMVMPKSMQQVAPARVRWPLGVVDVVYASATRRRARARGAARADGFAHIDPLLERRPGDARAADRLPDRVPEAAARAGARRPRRARATACGSGRCAGGAPRRGALLEPWAGAVVNSARDGAGDVRAEVPGRAAARRHRSRRRLGRRPVRAARARRPRAAAPGQARAHAGARRRPGGRRRLRRGARAASTRLDYRGRLSVEYFDLPDNGWPLDDPEQWATRPRRQSPPPPRLTSRSFPRLCANPLRRWIRAQTREWSG